MLQRFFQSLSKAPAPIRIGVFLCLLALFGGLGAIALSVLLRADPNRATIAAMGVLFLSFLVLVRWWGQTLYQHPNLLRHYGLDLSHQNIQGWLTGLVFGLSLTVGLFGVEAFFNWVEWRAITGNWLLIIIEGSLTGLGVAFAEELFFRGWLLDELQRDYAAAIVLWVNALIFAWLHFLKPIPVILETWPQFPSLMVLGLILVWAKRGSGDRLGMSIGLHGGLVWGYYIFNVGNVIDYTHQVPVWITGIDSNPLAGVLGLGLLTGVAVGLRQWAIGNRV